jgi:SAM-dependent methyltransferase
MAASMIFPGSPVLRYPHGDKPTAQAAALEVAHWNETERLSREGARLFWLNHPRVGEHYHRKSLIDGLAWQQWIPKVRGSPATHAIELGCGNGSGVESTWRAGTALRLTGIDLDESRFSEVRAAMSGAGAPVTLVAADINRLVLEPSSCDLVYALQSFHHFEELEHICDEVSRALVPGGYFVLDEFVGPARFQWTDPQLALTSQILGLLPRNLRMYRNGIEKLAEGRSSPEEVIRVCSSEAIRSNEIPAVFRKRFHMIHEKNLGGTIQHLLYSGIVHNFPDCDPATDHLIDCINGLEETFIGYRILPSDFMLLIGQKR